MGPPKGLNIAAEGIWSETKNEGTNVKSDFNGYLLNVSKRFGQDRKWGFRWRGRSYERRMSATTSSTPSRREHRGSQTGRTYREVYGLDPDFNRLSSRNRDVVDSKADLSYRFNRQLGSLRVIWDYDSVDREYYRGRSRDDQDHQQRAGALMVGSSRQGWKTNVLAKFGSASDPFNGVEYPVFDPGVATGRQPHGSDLGAVLRVSRCPDCRRYGKPRVLDSLRGSWNLHGEESSITANYRHWDGENTSGDLTDWSRLNQAASVTLWSSPAPNGNGTWATHGTTPRWIQWPPYRCSMGERAASLRARMARIAPRSSTTAPITPCWVAST